MTEITKKSIEISWLFKWISQQNLAKENVLEYFFPVTICREDYHTYFFETFVLKCGFFGFVFTK